MCSVPSTSSLVLLLIAAAAAAKEAPEKSLPPSWRVCQKSDPNLNDCIKGSIEFALADLSKRGAKEFGVLPIDPLLISQLQIAQGSGPVSIELTFNDLRVYGFKDTVVGEVQADLARQTIRVPVAINSQPVKLKGNYTIRGRILVLPINGQGDCEITIAKSSGLVNLKLKDVDRSGTTFWAVDKFKFSYQPQGMTLYFENLFQGNKQLGDQMNKFMNQNSEIILEELKPAIDEALSAAFGDITNRIFSAVPFKKLLL